MYKGYQSVLVIKLKVLVYLLSEEKLVKQHFKNGVNDHVMVSKLQILDK